MQARLAEIERSTCEALRDIAAVYPGLLSGDSFYEPRLKSGRLLTTEEHAAILFLASLPQQQQRVLEIGCGIGAVCIALAALGLDVAGVEADPRRWQLAQLLRSNVLGGDAERFQLTPGQYPVTCCPEADVILTTNVVNSFWATWRTYDPEKRKLQIFTQEGRCGLLFNARLWWKVREGADQQSQLANEMAGHLGRTAQHLTGPIWYLPGRIA